VHQPIPSRRAWRALDDLDSAKRLSSVLLAALGTGTVSRMPMKQPSCVTIRCETDTDRTHVDLPAILGSGFDLDLDGPALARHAIAACDDAGQEPQDVGHCARMASLILGSVPDIARIDHDAMFVNAAGDTGLPSAAIYDAAKGTDEWMTGRSDPDVLTAVGILSPLWFRPILGSSGNWSCQRAGFEEIEIICSPADPIEIMRAIDSARRDRPWTTR